LGQAAPRAPKSRIGHLRRKQTSGAEPLPAAALDPESLSVEARAIFTALDDLKAEEIVIIDLVGKTSIADLMIVATGRSTTQVGALADKVVKALKECGAATPAIEGLPACDWVLIDAGDVIVHLFRPEVRQFYNLEKMWGLDRPAEKRVEA
jgi:ribosome-associated protein